MYKVSDHILLQLQQHKHIRKYVASLFACCSQTCLNAKAAQDIIQFLLLVWNNTSLSTLKSILTGPIRVNGATHHNSVPINIVAVGVGTFSIGQPDGDLGPVAAVLDEAAHWWGPVCCLGPPSKPNNDTIQNGTLATYVRISYVCTVVGEVTFNTYFPIAAICSFQMLVHMYNYTQLP